MSFLKKIKDIFKKPATIFVLVVFSFGFFNIVQAGPIIGGGNSSNSEGTVYGFAWMGTNIQNPNSPEGGGGWIKFNCQPNECGPRRTDQWGVSIDLNSITTPEGYTLNRFKGEAWSPNYGFMTFDPSIVGSCWASNPDTFQGVASITNLNIVTNSNLRKIGGWAKFIAGDDFPTGSTNDDLWDGCVNFGNELNSAVQYGVQIDVSTGSLIGWAWGGPVVGWMSFTNPECPFCDTTVVLPNTVNINFWADQNVVDPGAGTTLHWQALNSSGRSVASCRASNSSEYPHWALGNDPTNVGAITTSAGNLPSGTHYINNINQMTHYWLDCRDNTGAVIPQKTVTIRLTTTEDVIGCMDSEAINYNPEATIDGRDCEYADSPTVSLSASTNISPNLLPLGGSNSSDYEVTTEWTFTNPNRVASCVGSFTDHTNTTRNIANWSGVSLQIPTSPSYPPGPFGTNSNVYNTSLLPGVTAGSQFTYTINCSDLGGNLFSDSAVVQFMSVPNTPDIDLEVTTSTLTAGVTPHNTGPITWDSTTLSSIVGNSCVGSVTGGNTSTLSDWSGPRANPNSSILDINLNNFTSGITTQTPLVFTITCQTTSGGSVSDSDTIIIQAAPAPPQDPAPTVTLVILNPANDNFSNYEVLPDTGSQVNLGWTIENATSCTSSSQMVVNGVVETNNSWNSSNFPPVSDTTGMNMTVPSAYGHPTTFWITCVNGNSAPVNSRVRVVIDGYICPPGIDPTCSPAPGSNIPGYEEF